MAVLLLGWLGIFGIGAIPLRSWAMVKHASVTANRGRTKAALLIVAAVLMLSVDLDIAIRVHRCLTTTYCGPSVASGWLYLALLGAVYGIFEMAACGTWIYERVKRHTAKPT